jgi:diguanylate cyclase (GGDEF)-like protein/PAS domain S-box-containing protein
MPADSSHDTTRRRLIAAVAGVSCAILAAIGLDLVDSRRHAVDNARSVSLSMTRLLSERLDGSVREVDYVLRDLVHDVSKLSPFPGGGKNMEIERLVAARRATLPQAASLSVFDHQGRPIASSPPAPDGDAGRDNVRAFAADGSLDATTQAAFGPANGKEGAVGASLVRARAVRDPDGGLVAVIAARIDVSIIQRELADLESGERRIIVIADPELRLVARRPEMPDAVGAELADAAMRGLLRSLKEAAPGQRSMSSETGPYFYCARIGEFPFFVAIGEAKSDILAEWNNRLLVYAVAMAAIVALIILLARLLDRNFSRSAELAARLVAMESATDMIVIASLEGKTEYVNPSFERTTGLAKSEVIDSRRAIFGPDEAEADAALAAAAAGESWRGEVATVRADGEAIVEEVTVAPVPGPGGAPVSIVAVLRDITERRRLQERLERLAHYDSLTGLPNRALFFDRLEGAVARARREERIFALLFIDLDGFKAVNDSHGHDAGDFLLAQVAMKLKAAIRDSDTAGRMGGDEFTVLLENISRPDDALAIADKIRASLTEPIDIPAGSSVAVGASVGVAVFPENGADGETIFKAADSAMYADKIAGGRHR